MKITIDSIKKTKETKEIKEEISEFYIQTFSLLFFPEDNIFGNNSASENYIKIFTDKREDFIDISLSICYNKKTVDKYLSVLFNNNKKLLLDIGKLFYEAAGELTGLYPPWGIHTGIRPAKIAGELLEKNNYDEDKANLILSEDYLMNKNKALLAIETYKNGLGSNCVSLSDSDFSLYVSIPFCPTRCKYCSFVSFSTPGLLRLIPEYIKKLVGETELIGKITKDLNLSLKSVYIGGGTPTTLDCESLEIILNAVKNNFDMTECIEYTVECGRADTITQNKLELLKNFGVGRISVNPQTLNDDILRKIGRNHTSGDFFKAFELAKSSGIKNINTDCIIGLPGESEESMIKTIKTLSEIKPGNITVHTFCVKKSSEFKIKINNDNTDENIYMPDAPELNSALEIGYDILKSAGYKPYYMYKQKYSAGNLENTGFCLTDCECLYNIYMMDELQTIFGVGAGAVTKLVKNGRIERVANYKYPYEYIERDFQISRDVNCNKLKILEG